MAVAANFDLEAKQLDTINAFTNSEIDETVYCQFPEGFKQQGQSLRLKRALYGLRRSPLLWLREFTKTLENFGLKRVEQEVCLFVNEWLILFFYVDDIVALFWKQDEGRYKEFLGNLFEKYEMREIGDISWFLGIRVLRDREQRKIWLLQDSYIEKITKKFHLEYAKPVHTPMATDELEANKGQASAQEIYEYQRKIGSVLYAAVITRPDIARATSKLSEFLQNPSPEHFAAVNRVIAYLYNTRTLAIEYSAEPHEKRIFACASDAAFADDPATRKSAEGYLFQLFGGAVDWKSKKQDTVTTSSTEAELLALTHAAKEQYWWTRIFRDINFDPGHKLTIACDNIQTIRLLEKDAPKLNTKLRHVDIFQNWLRQEVQNGNIKIEWIPTAQMTADGLTKPLPRQKHEIFIKQLGLKDIHEKLQLHLQ